MNEQIFLDHARARSAAARGIPPHGIFACDMSALDAAGRRRHAEVTRKLLLQAGPPRDLPDGYALAIGTDRDSLALAAEFIGRERLCCPFLGFRLDADDGPVAWLSLTGPAGVKPFLRAELGLAL